MTQASYVMIGVGLEWAFDAIVGVDAMFEWHEYGLWCELCGCGGGDCGRSYTMMGKKKY